MKTPEQLLAEWVADEIVFDLNLNKDTWSREAFESTCREFATRRVSSVSPGAIRRVNQTRDELEKVLLSVGWPPAKVAAWFNDFFAPQNIARYEGSDEVAAFLRVRAVEMREKNGWSAMPY